MKGLMTTILRWWGVQTQARRIIGFVAAFSVIGTAVLLVTKAQTPSSSIEAESGNLASQIQRFNDTSASGGQGVRFGAPIPGQIDPFDIPDTSYDAPQSNVKYVAPAPLGNDANNGDTKDTPYLTIDKAIQNIISGGTVVLRGGVYRQKVAKLTKAITIQAYKGEKPWIDGSVDITTGYASNAWTSTGAHWVMNNWNPAGLCRTNCMGSLTSNGVTYYVDGSDSNGTAAQNPAAKYVDQLFLNGQPLTQVSTLAELATNKFYINYSTNQLYIANNPGGPSTVVEASVHANAINAANVSNVALKGIGVRRFASTSSPVNTDQAAVFSTGNIYIENMAIVYNAGAGLAINNSAGGIVRNARIAYNGFIGARGNAGNSLKISGGRYAYNNTENFAQGGGASVTAGIKFTGLSNFMVSDAEIDHNNANGLWCDLGCNSAKWVRNWVHDNYWNGAFYEVSHSGIIASNRFARNNIARSNFRSGFKLSGSPYTVVANNTFVDNFYDYGFFHDGRSVNVNGVTTTIKEVYAVNNLAARTSTVATLPGNGFVNGLAQGSVTIPEFFLPSPPGGVNYNGFWRPDASHPTNIFNLSTTPTTNTVVLTGGTSPLINAGADDFRLTSAAASSYQGTSLSSAVVAAICIDLAANCVPTGTALPIGFLK